MFRTLKFRGSSLSFSLSVMQMRITEIAKYASWDIQRLFIILNLLLPSVAILEVCFSSSMGIKAVYGGRYLQWFYYVTETHNLQ